MTQEQFDNARAEGRWMDILKEAFIRSVTGEISLRTTLATVTAFFGAAARHFTIDSSVAGVVDLVAAGTDTNVDLKLTGKGIGGLVIPRLGLPLPTGRIQSPLLMSQGWVGQAKNDVAAAGASFPAVAPSGKIYIGSGTTILRSFNPANNTLEPTITVANGAQGVAYCPTNDRLYVACTTAGTVEVVNPNTNGVVASITAVAGIRSVAYVPGVDRIYVTNIDTDTVTVINPATNTIVTTIAAGAHYGLAYCPTNDRVYVGAAAGIAVINPSTNALVTTIAAGEIRGVAYCPSNNRIYASDYTGGTVRVIDPATNTIVATVTVGTNPWGIAYNPINDLIYALNFGSTNISIIRPASNVAERTVASPAGPLEIAFSPHDGLMYAGCATSGQIRTLS